MTQKKNNQDWIPDGPMCEIKRVRDFATIKGVLNHLMQSVLELDHSILQLTDIVWWFGEDAEVFFGYSKWQEWNDIVKKLEFCLKKLKEELKALGSKNKPDYFGEE